MKKLTELKNKDIKIIKEKWHTEQNKVCPLLKTEFDLCEMVIDHKHKLKAELPGPDGKGCCRGAIHRSANAFEGKVHNSYKRLGLNKFIGLSELLRNLADYLDNNRLNEDELFIHPNERVKPPKLSKSSYNKLKKTGIKLPPYNGNFTKVLEAAYEKAGLEPEFYRSQYNTKE